MLGEAASFFSRSTSGTNAAAEKKPMAIQPHELSKGSKLGDDRRLVGRLVDFQDTDQVLSCYLVCGPGRKQVIQIEAWRELKEAAKQVFHAGQLVSLTCVSLSLRKADKMKYSYSGVQVMVRFDKHLQVAPADEESSRSLCGFPELKLADLARTIPETSFKAASCLREGLVRIKCRVLEANAFTPKSGKSLGKALVHDTCPLGRCRRHKQLMGFGTVCPHWHGFNKKHGIMATLNAQRYLRYTEIGSKGADPRARDQRASQYLRTLLQELGFVARADERAADGDDRVMLIGLPRWLPEFHSDEGQDIPGSVAFTPLHDKKHFEQNDIDECLQLRTAAQEVHDDLERLTRQR